MKNIMKYDYKKISIEIDRLNKLPVAFSRFWINVIELLLVFPDFKDWVIKTRKKHKINPIKLTEEVKKIIGEKIYNDYYFMLEIRNPRSSTDLPDEPPISSEDFIKVKKKIFQLEKRLFPNILNDIGKLRNDIFGKIPLGWSEPIKEYLLYNKKINYPFHKRYGEKPVIKEGKEKNTHEPYYEVRIYGDTELSNIQSLLIKLQKELPTFHEIDKKGHDTAHRRWIYYYLRKEMDLKHDDANSELEKFGFKKIDYAHGSQELKRFEETFGLN